MRQVGRADEQHVDLVERGDRVGVGDGPADSIWTMPTTRSLIVARDVRVADRAHAAAARPQRDAALADRRVAQVRDGRSHLVDRLELRQHDPLGAQVERPPDPQALGGLRPDDRGHRRRRRPRRAGRAGRSRSPPRARGRGRPSRSRPGRTARRPWATRGPRRRRSASRRNGSSSGGQPSADDAGSGGPPAAASARSRSECGWRSSAADRR